MDDLMAPGGPGESRWSWTVQEVLESPSGPHKQRAQKEKQHCGATRRLLGPTTEDSLQSWIKNKAETMILVIHDWVRQQDETLSNKKEKLSKIWNLDPLSDKQARAHFIHQISTCA